MNFAEGKGPLQTKRVWPLGKFVTLYGNGTPSNVNPAPVPYPSAFNSGVNNLTTSGAVVSATPGSMVPGLNLNTNGNGAIAVGFVAAPDPLISLQDIENITANFWAEATFSGTAAVMLQASNNRYYQNTTYPSAGWVTLITGTLTAPSGNISLSISAASTESSYLAYRVVASGSGVGIIDWAIPQMFLDYNAMSIGTNALDANGSLGQMTIQAPKIYTISGGAITVTASGAVPYSNISADSNYIGPE